MVTVVCLCPTLPDGAVRHPEGDTITLRERLDFHGAITCRNAIALLKAEDPEASAAETLAVLTENYLIQGIVAWSLVDERGRAIAPFKSAIREFLLSNPDAAMVVGDAADELYAEQVLRPLLMRASGSSPATPTDDSTSASKPLPMPPPKQSKRSLTSTSRTADIGTTTSAPESDSSFSQSSASAA